MDSVKKSTIFMKTMSIFFTSFLFIQVLKYMYFVKDLKKKTMQRIKDGMYLGYALFLGLQRDKILV